MDIIFIRHAESQFNAKETGSMDSGLTKLGRKQAVEVSAFLKRKFDNLKEWTGYVSPFLRTLQTARTIHEHTEINFQVDFRIAEYAHMNSGYPFTPKGVKDLEIPLRKETFPFFGNIKENNWKQKGEFEAGLLNRLMDFLCFLKGTEGQYVVVSHAMPIYSMIYCLLGTPMVPKWDKKILNTSVTWFHNDKLRYFARHVNSCKDPRHEIMNPILFI